MSRDVAYRNGYLPLFAGAELIRRSGSLTQFPADNLIGTLPPLPACDATVNYLGARGAKPSGTSLGGISTYENLIGVIEAQAGLGCAWWASALDEAMINGGGALPFVPSGSAALDLLNPADYVIDRAVPTIASSATFRIAVSPNDGDTPIEFGTLVLNMSPLGVKTLDTSGLNLTGYPTAFEAGVMVTQFVQPIGSTNTFALPSWWPMFRMQFNSSSNEFVSCLIGPCGV